MWLQEAHYKREDDNMLARFWLVSGSLLAALDVALAAFGAHGLKETLERIVPAQPATVIAQETAAAAHRAGEERAQAAPAAAPAIVPQREQEIAKRLANFDTAVRYQMYHALGLIALGLLMTRQRSRWLTVAGWLILGGVAVFSGLLYALVFSGPRILEAILPFGGAAMILGWVALATGAWRGNADLGLRNLE
jgi:uncharacterized membrane protein YgdD (TMEM256/DUF423 family)